MKFINFLISIIIYLIISKNSFSTNFFHLEDYFLDKAILLNLEACDYCNGTNGKHKNREKAVELLRESLELEYSENFDAITQLPIALNELGADYFYGNNGMEKNLEKAAQSFAESLELGHENAKANLADTLFTMVNKIWNYDRIDIENEKKCLKLLKKSYLLGNQKAKNYLSMIINDHGCYYYNGQHGFDISLPKAISYFREAMALGNQTSKENLATALYVHAGDYINGTSKIEANEDKAIELLMEASELGDNDASNDLAKLIYSLNEEAYEYFVGSKAVPKDLLKAFDLLTKAISINPHDNTSQNNLARVQAALNRS